MILINSFSGGRTSAYMTYMMINNLPKKYSSVINIFANTGQEHEKTLEFVNNCDKEFGFNTVWIESVVHHNQRKGNTHKIVDFETACRDRSLFEEMIKKHGIPNQAFPHCTRELKLAPINSYIKSLGLKNKDTETALGIRIDETRRVNKNAVKVKIIYPLIDFYPTTKQMILDWWKHQDFDLGIMEHHGNCTWCWKKSLKKHLMLINEMPDIFDIPRYFEKTYPFNGAHKDKSKPRTFFRGNRSTDDLFKEKENNDSVLIDDMFSECGESCELFQMVNKL